MPIQLVFELYKIENWIEKIESLDFTKSSEGDDRPYWYMDAVIGSAETAYAQGFKELLLYLYII